MTRDLTTLVAIALVAIITAICAFAPDRRPSRVPVPTVTEEVGGVEVKVTPKSTAKECKCGTGCKCCDACPGKAKEKQ